MLFISILFTLIHIKCDYIKLERSPNTATWFYFIRYICYVHFCFGFGFCFYFHFLSLFLFLSRCFVINGFCLFLFLNFVAVFPSCFKLLQWIDFHIFPTLATIHTYYMHIAHQDYDINHVTALVLWKIWNLHWIVCRLEKRPYRIKFIEKQNQVDVCRLIRALTLWLFSFDTNNRRLSKYSLYSSRHCFISSRI